MSRLKTLRSPLQGLPRALQGPPVTAEKRMVGRHLQKRRMRMWLAADARCARCGVVVEYPHGFDLDHVVPLYKGGADIEQNTQVLCNAPNGGCHAIKTREDMARD